ncbi:hypothetical protein PHYPO_G00005330 [Pangasianodon hypophthalmus]|uniref:ITPR-interacting domain-containing protein n=1 Tax=Pangasianodon hypophthalmus TaxID=310915 RepID=A0A5N5Q689_PANHP|nr:hypothetical protein PHYPO_G00005330 [Pangasianodon hypophthalmus]
MDADHVSDKRVRLLASKTRWSEMDDVTATQPLISADAEKCNQDSINQWHIHITDEDAQQENIQDYAAQHLRKTGMSEDDLALLLKASLYGKTTVNTVQGFLRTYPERPPLTSAWNSLASGISSQSGPPSAMDVLTLWQDDPEELLLDLGFGAEEPDITVKIPARFINHQSQARGINVQVFLEAQQNRIDIENPDVRNRFRQIEVLQQVTTAFNSLVGSVSPGAQGPVESQLSEEARLRRKRVGMLFRNASKKSLSQLGHSRDKQPLCPSLAGQSSSPELPGDLPLDKRIPLKRASLSPLVEEQTFVSEEAECTETTTLPQVKSSSPRGSREMKNVTSAITSAKEGTGVPAESFELEEIQSFDEGSIGGTCTGTPDQPGNERACLSRVRTNSCQSDSSGFLEEPFVPAYPNPGPELMKVLNAMSGDSTESPQKSVDLQETAVPSPYTQDSDKLLKQTEWSATDSNVDKAMGPAHIGMIISTEDTTKRHLQDTNRTDCLVNKEVVQKDIVGDYVGESTTLLKDSPGLCGYGANIVQSTTLKKDSPGLYDYSTNSLKSTTLQEDSAGLHDYSANAVQNTTLQKDSPGLVDYGTSTIQSTTFQQDSPVLHDYGASFGESITFQKNSLNPSHDVVVGGDSQMKIQSSDVSVFKTDSSSTDPKAGTENKVPSPTEGYYGRSVSVQMCSSLASQSSLRGSISHNSSTGQSPISDVQLRRECREQLDSDVANIPDSALSTNIATTMEHTLPNPWQSKESFKGPHSTSLDKGRSYEEDTRWETALWSGAQSCGSCGHKQRFCCQNKNSEEQYSGSPEQLHPASSLPYSMEELISMMRCMWKFRKMLTEIEERLEEEQESVNSSISEEHRAEVQDILKLRTAVKKESEMLEQQLSDLVEAYDDNVKMKMNRLLDEQSHLCTQLRFTPQPGHISKKSVGIQCTLLTDSPESCLSTQLTDDTRLIHSSEWSPGGKADKLDFVGFIKSLKDGPISNDSLE